MRGISIECIYSSSVSALKRCLDGFPESELCFQKIEVNRVSFYTEMSDGMPIGNFLFDHQVGKLYSISFMVVMSLDGNVRDVETLVYREPHGWEVRYPFFHRPVQRDNRRHRFSQH